MTTKFFEHQGGRIAYEEMGSGPLVLCVPAMGDLRSGFRFLAPRLVEAGYHVVSMDNRGHGETSTDWADYSAAAVSQDILGLIRHLNAGPAMIIGVSMAAGAAAMAAAEAPELVSGLALLGPAVHGNASPVMLVVLKVLFSRPWGPALWKWYYSTLFPTRKPADFAEFSEKLKRNLAEPGRIEALYKMAAVMVSPNQKGTDWLEQVRAPALVIMGSKDPDFKDPRAEAEWLAQKLRARCEIIEGAGHHTHGEMPEQVVPLVLSFVQSIYEPKLEVYGA